MIKVKPKVNKFQKEKYSKLWWKNRDVGQSCRKLLDVSEI